MNNADDLFEVNPVLSKEGSANPLDTDFQMGDDLDFLDVPGPENGLGTPPEAPSSKKKKNWRRSAVVVSMIGLTTVGGVSLLLGQKGKKVSPNKGSDAAAAAPADANDTARINLGRTILPADPNTNTAKAATSDPNRPLMSRRAFEALIARTRRRVDPSRGATGSPAPPVTGRRAGSTMTSSFPVDAEPVQSLDEVQGKLVFKCQNPSSLGPDLIVDPWKDPEIYAVLLRAQSKGLKFEYFCNKNPLIVSRNLPLSRDHIFHISKPGCKRCVGAVIISGGAELHGTQWKPLIAKLNGIVGYVPSKELIKQTASLTKVRYPKDAGTGSSGLRGVVDPEPPDTSGISYKWGRLVVACQQSLGLENFSLRVYRKNNPRLYDYLDLAESKGMAVEYYLDRDTCGFCRDMIDTYTHKFYLWSANREGLAAIVVIRGGVVLEERDWAPMIKKLNRLLTEAGYLNQPSLKELRVKQSRYCKGYWPSKSH